MTVMKNLFLGFIATLLVAEPAYADKYVYYGDDHYHGSRHRHHDRGWHGRGHHYVPYVKRTYISNRYYEPSYDYSEVRCTNNYNPLGLLLGGAAGGIVGKQIGKGRGNTAAIIGGAVLGSAIGSGVYQTNCTEQVIQQVPVGTPISWQDARNQEYYSVTTTNEYRRAGRYCREYQARATVGGRIQDTYGTACMQPDGSWEVIN